MRDGGPSGQRKLNLSRDYKDTKLCREGQTRNHSLFWEVAAERFCALTPMQDQTATEAWAKEAYQELEANL